MRTGVAARVAGVCGLFVGISGAWDADSLKTRPPRRSRCSWARAQESRCSAPTGDLALDRRSSAVGSFQVFDDLVSPRPLLRGDDQIDVSPAELIQGPICHEAGVDTHRSELIAPRQRGLGLLERAHRLPAIEPWVADGHRRFLANTALEETRDPHATSLRVTDARWMST